MTDSIDDLLKRHVAKLREGRPDEHRRLRDLANSLCKIGDTVRLIHFGSIDPDPLQPGDEGKVIHIDDAGTIHVDWKSGRKIGIIPDADRFEVINEA